MQLEQFAVLQDHAALGIKEDLPVADMGDAFGLTVGLDHLVA
jgi:hypothetical protein